MKTLDWLVAIALTAALAGCGDEAVAPVNPDDAGALLALAPQLTFDRLAAELALEPRQGEEFGRRLEALHLAMRDAHDRMPEDGRTLTAAEEAALDAAMALVHERHGALLDVLDADQRERFAAHVHARLAEHHRDGGAEKHPHPVDGAAAALRDRLHGSPHGAGAGTRHP
jgi:hypothetical protein